MDNTGYANYEYNEITFIWFGQILIGSQFLFLQISIIMLIVSQYSLYIRSYILSWCIKFNI